MLIDTSTLLRTLQSAHPQRETARNAIKTLAARGRELNLVPQNLMELWVVATRPATQNGLGFSIAEAHTELLRLKSMFRVLPETPAIYPAWESLVVQYRVVGKAAHDARLVAAIQVHGLTGILTFDLTGPDSHDMQGSRLCIPMTSSSEQTAGPQRASGQGRSRRPQGMENVMRRCRAA